VVNRAFTSPDATVLLEDRQERRHTPVIIDDQLLVHPDHLDHQSEQSIGRELESSSGCGRGAAAPGLEAKDVDE
jgi:hypothetical protein